jgi:hypothetical protein
VVTQCTQLLMAILMLLKRLRGLDLGALRLEVDCTDTYSYAVMYSQTDARLELSCTDTKLTPYTAPYIGVFRYTKVYYTFLRT